MSCHIVHSFKSADAQLKTTREPESLPGSQRATICAGVTSQETLPLHFASQLACALAFLRFNGFKVQSGQDTLYDLVIGVAEGRIDKDAVASFFENHSSSASLPL